MSSLAGLRSWNAEYAPWNTKSPLARELGPLLGGLVSDPHQNLQAAVDREIRARLAAFHHGVTAYRRHPYRRAMPAPGVMWRDGTTRLLDYGGEGRPVLVIPSLVNRAYILDLAPDNSLLRWLVGQGWRPLLVDWGGPGPVERQFHLTDYIERRLVPALDRACRRDRRSVPVIGYCMGGNLAVALAAGRPERVSRLALLATPWDFHAGPAAQGRTLAQLVAAWAPVLDAMHELPVDAIQTLFWLLDPFLVQRKFIKFAALDQTSTAALNFVALEDWLNDGVPLAAPVAHECLALWYGQNTPAEGQWAIGGETVRPRDVSCPALVMVPQNDRIVPPESALALARELPSAHVMSLPLGHIGMIAGRRARSAVWKPLSDWLGQA